MEVRIENFRNKELGDNNNETKCLTLDQNIREVHLVLFPFPRQEDASTCTLNLSSNKSTGTLKE